MAWVRTEDTARLHPKFFRAGLAAWGWWNAALGYCNQHLSDGFISSRDILLVFPGTKGDDVLDAIAHLVAENLVHIVNVGRRVTCLHKCCRKHRPLREGYLLHDFSDYQPQRVKVLKRRMARSRAGRQGGVQSGISRKQVASTWSKQNRTPTRPDPTRNTKDSVADANGSNGTDPKTPRRHPLHGQHCDCQQCSKARAYDTAHPTAEETQP